MYSERNNQDRYDKKQYDKTRSRVYVAEKQEENKNINNKEVENSLKVKKCESDYHVVKEFSYHATNLNVNFYKVNFYNQENKKPDINFVTILII